MENQLQIHRKLLNQIIPQKLKWQSILRKSQENIESIPVHALLTAAAATYLPLLSAPKHKSLWQNWLTYCASALPMSGLVENNVAEHNNIVGAYLTAKRGFAIQQVLAEEKEIRSWEEGNFFSHPTIMEKAILWRSNIVFGESQFTFISDPQNQYKSVLKALKMTAMQSIDRPVGSCPFWNDIEFVEVSELNTAASIGTKRVLLLMANQGEEIDSFLHRARVYIPLLSKHSLQSVCLLFPQNIPSLPISLLVNHLPSVTVLNLEMGEEEIMTLLLHRILQYADHQLWMRRIALLTDLSYHKQELKQCQVSI